MLYNPLLETFIAVADAGSFAKASETLYISPTAIMKQMNQLEYLIGYKLFDRTPSGIKITKAGESIYKDAKFVIDYSKKAIEEARKSTVEADRTFCVGTSLLNPAKPFMDLWYNLTMTGEPYFSDYKIHLVPFNDDHNDILKLISGLGELFDFIVAVCDSQTWMKLANFEKLGSYPIMIAVPRKHPLAKKEKLRIEDLTGQTLMMVGPGDSKIVDTVRNDLLARVKGLKIVDTSQYYDLSVYSKVAEDGDKLLISASCWNDVHPGLVTLPVEWDYEIPYGLLYSLKPTPDILDFIEAVREYRKAK